MDLSVAILGSGNMAYHLLKACGENNIHVAGLISRDLNRGLQTIEGTKSNCQLFGGSHLADLEADIVLLAVPDSQLTKVQKFYEFNPDHIVAHTSGSVSIDELRLERTGVFYPLQTLTWGENIDYSDMPIMVEGSSITTEEKLMALGQAISSNVKLVLSNDRMIIHLAAVLASNFPNHLFKRASELLEPIGLKLDDLSPLIDEMIRKSRTIGPADAQTGPARRNDENTIQKHLDMLNDPDVRTIYKSITTDIRKSYE